MPYHIAVDYCHTCNMKHFIIKIANIIDHRIQHAFCSYDQQRTFHAGTHFPFQLVFPQDTGQIRNK